MQADEQGKKQNTVHEEAVLLKNRGDKGSFHM
jgi:hypothetical protein